MEIIVGKYSGFCSGVDYTYKKALEVVKQGKIYCLGEIIHNDLVIKELEDLGMVTVNKITDVPKNNKVIFRAHGEPIDSYLYAKENSIEVIDLTCGRVKAIHNIVEREKNNSFIVIIGKKTHPEIVGTVGFAGNNYFVIENENDIDLFYSKYKESKIDNIYIISQTTFSSSLFDLLAKKVIEKVGNKDIITINKTICDATNKRQKECFDISMRASLMLVLGGKNSSNTKELYEIARKNCKRVIFIEKR
ncbi:MAG: 4-hydroxy-3-methylbut-2-enyl diphosphate reductase [Bacilli bacterium]|nr:4-hydroxy-3-methylbut-2-enyl diphosphate reductase [Bacilli bacterium]